MQERTLVIVKPDAYQRGLTGVILACLEQRGLVVEAMRVSRNEKETVEDHYPRSQEWLATVGGKTLEDYARLGISAKDRLGTDDAVEIGLMVRTWLTEFLLSAPVVPMVISGNRAIETVRKIVGHTLPVMAAPGTIRGDYSSDSPDLANSERRPVQNLVHASGDPEEAEREIALWFPELS
ncbi:MAG TPA: nucleoside-diphosphate kinase [Streptosporangiaceae bacterium]|nr:nucleoside-diphosphate kinase [Streptosporangiaceae bacterium]